MKIAKVDDYEILFDNGNHIEDYHSVDCCECNYADYRQIEEMAMDYEFDEDLQFEAVEGCGFRFGNKNGRMFFIPCYTEQNGYYSTDINIYYFVGDECAKKLYLEDCESVYRY